MQKEHLEIHLESIDNKLQLVLEGLSSLANQIRDTRQELIERADLTDFKLDVLSSKLDAVDERLSNKIDLVSADIKAHRADTEVHHGIYLVKES